MDALDQPSQLSYEYVQNTIFRKLSDTCDRYRDLLPEIESVENAIVSADHENYFALTMMMINTLIEYAERSKAVQEILDNVRMDFWHGLDSRYPAHIGKYYISSVSDTE